MKLSDLITVAPRYTRSVNIERDAGNATALGGYVITSTAYAVLGRLLASLRDKQGNRAWTLTGPYGSGKSAFALFVANLLSGTDGASPFARRMLKDQHPDLHRDFFEKVSGRKPLVTGYATVSITGTQKSLADALLEACVRDLAFFLRGSGKVVVCRSLTELRSRSRAGAVVSVAEVVQTITGVSRHLVEAGKSAGLLIVVDELGKFLEFSAANPDQSDIYILQSLAEATAPSAGNHLCVVTVLHQAFDKYASSLRIATRDEWAKIQGRFEDVAFQEPPDQILELLAAAIQQKDHPATKKLRTQARHRADRAFELGLAPRGAKKPDFLRNAERCAPLHPITALALARLCRKFGQNQRSLFSFLVSREPHGFSDFLEQTIAETGQAVYSLPELFDYVAESLGPALSAGESGIRWAEAQNALDKAFDCSAAEVRLLKSVGLLAAAGTYGELKPSEAVLRAALESGGDSTFTPSYRKLIRRSLLVERKYNGTVGLWEGSDIDIDERVREAAQALPESPALSEKLNALYQPRPIVAKRHSYRTGTLRYFAVRFSDVTNLTRSTSPHPEADGLLIYALPATDEDFLNLRKLAATCTGDHAGLVVALPHDTSALRAAIRHLELLHWVTANTPELQADPVARRELKSRVLVAEARVSVEIQQLYQPAGSSARRTLWFYKGAERQLSTSRNLANLLSAVCDDVYSQTPAIRNELINRRFLSSAAAAARRNLLEAMIHKGTTYRLGFEGHPPEVSIYCSVLEEPGIHRMAGATAVFRAPDQGHSIHAAWQAMESFLADSELEKRPVADLFARLQQPPYGIKMGVLPIMFTALVSAYETEVAIYEEGIFVPEISTDLLERLIKSADKFEIRRYRIEGVRREVFEQMAVVLGSAPKQDINLVELMRPMFRFFNRLPAYTRQTKKLGPIAQRVREALFTAREPDNLLFNSLPVACGVPAFLDDKPEPEAVAAFFKAWKSALVELQKAYDDLLGELRDLLFQALGVSDARGRETIQLRAGDVLGHCVDSRLRAFVLHLADDNLEEPQWVEAIGTMIVGKVPRAWNDNDKAQFEVRMAELVRSFRHILLLVNEHSNQQKQSGSVGEVIRIGVADLYSGDLEEVVSIGPADQTKLAELVIVIEQAIDSSRRVPDESLMLAALARVARKYLRKTSRERAQERPTVLVENRRG